jgi:hypothetical protein
MARIIDVKVDWMEGWGNNPKFVVRLDREESPENFRFVQRGSCYVAQIEDLVRFFSYSGPGDGYGGHQFEITMVGEEKRTLIGPWSGNSGWVNDTFPELRVVEAVIEPNWAGAVDVSGIVRWMDSHPDCGFGLAEVTWGGSRWYEPTRNGKTKNKDSVIVRVLI